MGPSARSSRVKHRLGARREMMEDVRQEHLRNIRGHFALCLIGSDPVFWRGGSTLAGWVVAQCRAFVHGSRHVVCIVQFLIPLSAETLHL